MDTKVIFEEFAEAFEKKIDKDYYIKLQYEITDEENGIWQIDVNNSKVFLYNENKIEPEETFVLSKETLIKIYNNELNAYAASLHSPNEGIRGLIEFKNIENIKMGHGKKTPDELSSFISRHYKFHDFFSKDYPTKIIVDNKNSVKHANVNAIALHNNHQKNITHVYFSIKKNEKMYQPSCEFSLYVLNGKGSVLIGNENFSVCAKEYYHIKPKETVFIENKEEELLEILCLWDEYKN